MKKIKPPKSVRKYAGLDEYPADRRAEDLSLLEKALAKCNGSRAQLAEKLEMNQYSQMSKWGREVPIGLPIPVRHRRNMERIIAAVEPALPLPGDELEPEAVRLLRTISLALNAIAEYLPKLEKVLGSRASGDPPDSKRGASEAAQ